MKNLSELKRYLTLKGAALRLVSYEWLKGNEWVSVPPHNPNFRFVAKLQTNAVALEDDTMKSGKSWLDFGKASEWAFDRSTNTMVRLSGGVRLTYKWANVAIIEGETNA
jgi:hypothetical protein